MLGRTVSEVPSLLYLGMFPSSARTSKAARLPVPGPFLVLSDPTQHPSHLGTGWGPQKREGGFMCCHKGSGRRPTDEGRVLGTRGCHHGGARIARRCRERGSEQK